MLLGQGHWPKDTRANLAASAGPGTSETSPMWKLETGTLPKHGVGDGLAETEGHKRHCEM